VEREVPWVELWDAFGGGVYLFFSLIHFDLYLRRRDRTAHLFVALASAGALVVDGTGMVLRRLGPQTPAALVFLNFLGVSVATVALFELVAVLGDRPVGRTARGAEVLLLLLPVVLPFLTSLQVFYLLMVFGFLAVSTVLAFQAARRGDRESGTVASGFLVLVACLGADVLKELGLLPVPAGLPILGFIVLFLASARSLNDRFGREEDASRTDSLTGLKNRRGFLEACDQALRRSRRSGLPLSVILADLDHFKRVNDAQGHRAGDDVLRKVAREFVSSLREQDTVGRWGGEEFVFLLPDTGLAGALRVAENLRRRVAGLAIAAGRDLLTVSMGVAEYRPGTDIEETVAQADRALYRAKEAGRNRSVADGSFTTEALKGTEGQVS
jgi:diguanylate cyclase (GGDEF)-like protein